LAEPQAERYEEDVARWIAAALSQREVAWPDLLRSLPGVYPSEVIAALSRLTSGTLLPVASVVQHRAAAVIEDARSARAARVVDHHWEAGGVPLPVPHPLDFEWRFSPEAVELLLERCERASATWDTIALVGAPTLMIGAAERKNSRNHVLLDRNRAVVALLLDALPGAQVFVFDACQDPPPGYNAAVTVLDPPWYDAHFRGFLWTAARLTAPGGRVLLSLPALGTRPGIREERAALLQWADQLGLTLIDLEEGPLPYVTPPFERNALRAAGVANCPSDWRRGDLATFELREATGTSREAGRPTPPSEALLWPEVSACGVRVRFKPLPSSSPVAKDLALRAIVPGDVLPSVSSRDPRRSLAAIWTSGNRVFRFEHPLLLRAALQASLNAEEAGDGVSRGIGRTIVHPERDQLREASTRLMQVIHLEHEEYVVRQSRR
jgi:hypothetical protein